MPESRHPGEPPSSGERSLLHDSEARLRLLEQNVRDYAIFTVDLDGRIASWNAGSEEILGYGETEIIGELVSILFPPEDVEAGRLEEEMQAARQDGRTEHETWRVRKNGSRFRAVCAMTALRDGEGRLHGYAKILRDVTERRREQERVLRIFESITDAFFALDESWRFTYVNAQAEAVLQRSRRELLGKCVWEEFPEAAGSKFESEYRLAVEERSPRTFEEHFPPLDAWFLVRAYPALDGLSVYFQDVTLRKRAEEARAASEELLRVTLMSIGDGVIATDAGMRVRFMNPVAEELTGWTHAEAEGREAREVFRIIDETARQEVDSPLRRAVEQGAAIGAANHTILIARNGMERAVEDGGAPIRNSAGGIVGAVLVFRDATERRRTDREIQTLNVRLQRAMTETHHRVKNNLQLISALIEMQQAGGAETVPMAEFARLGSNVQALAIIHDILTQEAKEGSGQETLSARAVLEQLLSVLSQTTGGRGLKADLADVRLSGRQTTTLALVTNELVSNALKHGQGEVEVGFRVEGGPEDVQAVLDVCDDGPGFPSGFDAKASKNTGLELVESIVAWDLRGSIRYENLPRGGARIAVAFPVSAGRPSSRREA